MPDADKVGTQPTAKANDGVPDKPAYQPDIKLWRDRAEEARTQAEQMTDPVCRSMMVQIAETYERMIDRQLSTNRLLQLTSI